jgi:hypothetical protein
MSAMCKAYSTSRTGKAAKFPKEARQAFYAGWKAAMEEVSRRKQKEEIDEAK